MDKPLPPSVVALTEQDAADFLKALHIPFMGTVYPLPDPVYGHTFKIPAVKGLVGGQQRQIGGNDAPSNSNRDGS
jgi:hypothetical protein